MNCAQCGKVLAPGAKFCTGCGTPVAAGPAPPYGMPPPPGATQQQPPAYQQHAGAPPPPQQPAPGQPQSYLDQRKLEQQAVLKDALRNVNPRKDKAALFRARTAEERDQEYASEAIRENTALRNTRIATLVAAVLCGLFWGWFTRLSMSEFGVVAWVIGGLIGALATFTCRGKADQNILFIAGFSAVLGILIGKVTTYVLLREQIASGEFMLLTGFDLIWLALAVLAAVEMPHRLAPLFATEEDKRIRAADVPDAVQREHEQAVSPTKKKTMYVLGGALVVLAVVMAVLLIIKTFNYGVGEKYKSTPQAGAWNFHSDISITLPDKNWFVAESGFKNNRESVVAVCHRGKKNYDIRLKIFRVNKDLRARFEKALASRRRDPDSWHEFLQWYTDFVLRAEFGDLKLEKIDAYENGDVSGYLVTGESGEGKKQVEHTVFISNPYGDNEDEIKFYFLWFMVRGNAGDDAYAEIESIIQSLGIYE